MKKQMLAAALCLVLLSGCSLGGSDSSGAFSGNISMPSQEELMELKNGEKSSLQVDASNIEPLLSAIQRPEGMVWKTAVTYHGTKDRTITTSVYVSGEMARVESYENGNLTGAYLVRDGYLYTFAANGKDYYRQPYEEELGYDTLGHLGGIQDFLPIAQEDVVSSQIVHSDSDGTQLKFVVKDEELGLEDSYVFSMEYGVPIQVESKLNGKSTYQLVTTELAQEQPQESYFQLPEDGTLLS